MQQLGLEGISWDHLVWSHCSSRACWSRLPRTMFNWVLSTSTDGDFTMCLGNLFQCLATLIVKKCFPMFKWNFWGVSLSFWQWRPCCRAPPSQLLVRGVQEITVSLKRKVRRQLRKIPLHTYINLEKWQERDHLEKVGTNLNGEKMASSEKVWSTVSFQVS